MFLLSRLLRSLQNATRPAVVQSPNGGPDVPPVTPAVGRVHMNVAPPARQIDGATVPLPPVQSRYHGRRPNVKALNRNSGPSQRHGSTRTAVGL